jgi:hypothetical protein
MVSLWSTLGFVVETTPDDAPKDLYEVEFNQAPPAVMMVAAAAPRAAVRPRTTAKTRNKRRARS